MTTKEAEVEGRKYTGVSDMFDYKYLFCTYYVNTQTPVNLTFFTTTQN